MKPTPQISHNQRGSGRENGTRRSKRRLLLTDYNYHPTAETQLTSSAGRPVKKLPAFHKLSSEFFGTEMSRDYVTQFLLFTIIGGISAWPIISMLLAVTRLLRNY